MIKEGVMSRLIGIDEISGGMELAVPVKNKFGQILLSVDTKLEDKHKKLLKMWGVQSLYVKSDGNSEEEIQYDEKTTLEAEALLQKRFLWKPRNAIEEELYQMALGVTLEQNF